MEKAFGTWGIKTVTRAQFRLGALTEREQIEARYGGQISRLAKYLFKSILQTPFRPSFYSLIAFTVQQELWSRSGVDHDTVDYRFWRESGWLDRGRFYYVGTLAKSPRMMVARVLGKVIALFFG